jgi:hypothetical protein
MKFGGFWLVLEYNQAKVVLGPFFGYNVDSKILLCFSGSKYTQYEYRWKALKIFYILLFKL